MFQRIFRRDAKPKRVKRTHDLFCECRRCVKSINTYVKEIMES